MKAHIEENIESDTEEVDMFEYFDYLETIYTTDTGLLSESCTTR